MITVDHFAPMMTIEDFSSSCGVTAETVRGWVKRGYVPTLKLGRRRMINVVALGKMGAGQLPNLQGRSA
jgi:hypothetical protein